VKIQNTETIPFLSNDRETLDFTYIYIEIPVNWIITNSLCQEILGLSDIKVDISVVLWNKDWFI